MIFSLDLPASTNRMYRRAGNIIHKSAEYRDWLNASGWKLAAQIKGRSTIKGNGIVERRVKKRDAMTALLRAEKGLGVFRG